MSLKLPSQVKVLWDPVDIDVNKIHYNQNTLTGWVNSNFTIYLSPKYILNIFWKVKIIKAPAGFELTANRFVINAPTQCSVLLNKNFGYENTFVRRNVKHESVPYNLNCTIKGTISSGK